MSPHVPHKTQALLVPHKTQNPGVGDSGSSSSQSAGEGGGLGLLDPVGLDLVGQGASRSHSNDAATARCLLSMATPIVVSLPYVWRLLQVQTAARIYAISVFCACD